MINDCGKCITDLYSCFTLFVVRVKKQNLRQCYSRFMRFARVIDDKDEWAMVQQAMGSKIHDIMIVYGCVRL